MVSGSPVTALGTQARALDPSRGPLHVGQSPFAHPGISGTSRERIPTQIIPQAATIARVVAERIATLIRERATADRPLVLGLATGSTPIGVYRELVQLHRDEGLSFRHVVTFNLDEYYPMSPESLHSYHRYMWEHLFAHVDIDPSHVHLPDGTLARESVDEACAAYEAQIRAFGGLDFQLLGIGKTGHIGFNEPGSGEGSRTRLVHLDSITRRDAAADFFGEENVPREAITMGIATILEAREVVIIATGEHKAKVVQRAIEGEIDRAVAATFLQRHPNTTFYVDEAASADLTRVATPWLIDEVRWSEALAVRAVTWLATTTGKAILKLTPSDYADHGMTTLVGQHGSAGAVNGLVFNILGAKIRGKSKLPRGLRAICFSPHPDDDVISMGGILRKFVENGNQMTVAYMTSGNIAVFDHDVRRYLDFLERLSIEQLGGSESIHRLHETVSTFLDRKGPGEVDRPEVQDIKRLIRESEAVSGLEVMGLTRDHARFLNLPFYQTGKVRKDPIGPEDVGLVAALLREVHPDVIFVAGDLSDPHGTHRMCKEAIDQALVAVYGDTPAARPEVWLYRGAWQEWPVTEATVLVPMSQEELTLKIQAIFKHQSQKDSMPFPGQDTREFWQRVEQRNKGTAAHLDALGLAEYFAMEAYVIA
jgi:glucosamine-6-phosphate deaminase